MERILPKASQGPIKGGSGLRSFTHEAPMEPCGYRNFTHESPQEPVKRNMTPAENLTKAIIEKYNEVKHLLSGDILPIIEKGLKESGGLQVTMLKTELEELKQKFSFAQTAIAAQASNALIALEDDDHDEVTEILKALGGE